MFNGEALSVSSINCNSLNMSQSAKWNQRMKINGITKLGTDIIFLSDVRISNKNLISAADDVARMFKCNQYDQYNILLNSTKNSRGVGILLKCSLQYSVQEEVRTEDENILAASIIIKGTEIAIISIYGPNKLDEIFFTRLCEIVDRFRHLPIIIGGDWNCTYSTNALESNEDVLNMKRLPNTYKT
jgi:exonuclease III